jgi:hypothetical protein
MPHDARVVDPHKGTPLPDHDRRRLARLVDRDGERAVIELIGCSKNALRSALAARPIYKVTASAITAALERAAR